MKASSKLEVELMQAREDALLWRAHAMALQDLADKLSRENTYLHADVTLLRSVLFLQKHGDLKG